MDSYSTFTLTFKSSSTYPSSTFNPLTLLQLALLLNLKSYYRSNLATLSLSPNSHSYHHPNLSLLQLSLHSLSSSSLTPLTLLPFFNCYFSPSTLQILPTSTLYLASIFTLLLILLHYHSYQLWILPNFSIKYYILQEEARKREEEQQQRKPPKVSNHFNPSILQLLQSSTLTSILFLLFIISNTTYTLIILRILSLNFYSSSTITILTLIPPSKSPPQFLPTLFFIFTLYQL